MTTQASSTGDGTDASSGGEIGTSSAQSTGTTGDEDPSSSSEGGGQPIVSFESDVRPLFEQHCDTVCHAVDGAPFDYDALMVTAMFCDLPLVTPGVPEESALWIKLTEDVDDSPVLQCGREMPPLGEGSLRFVDPEAAEVVRQWIASGALP